MRYYSYKFVLMLFIIIAIWWHDLFIMGLISTLVVFDFFDFFYQNKKEILKDLNYKKQTARGKKK